MMPENLPPEIYLPHPDSAPYQPTPPKTSRGKKIIAGTAVAAVLAVGAAAGYAYTVLASSGVQPERVLPANTVAFAKLDLDPAASQKIAAYRLSKKFPALSNGAANLAEEKNAALATLFGKHSELDYTTDIKPWLGDRAAVAAVADAASESGLDPVVAVAYTNENKMRAALSKAARSEKNFGYVTVDGYALVTDSQAHAEAILAGVRRATLAANEHYRTDRKFLKGGQLAVGWVDASAVAAALKASDQPAFGLGQLKSLSAAGGRVIMGAHAGSDYFEVTAAIHQDAVGDAPRAADKPVRGNLLRLDSATTSAALEVSGLGDAFDAAWKNAVTGSALRQQWQDLAAAAGLRLPTDLTALLGTDTTVSGHLPAGAAGEPDIAVEVSTSGADRALQFIDQWAQQPLNPFAANLQVTPTAEGYRVSTSASYQPQARAGSLALGDDPAFARAVPNRAKAGLIGYVNIGNMLDSDQQGSVKNKAEWKHAGSLGLSVSPTADGWQLLLRLTTR